MIDLTLKFKQCYLRVCVLALGAACAQAQSAGSAPSAGSLQQQIEREQQSSAPRPQIQPPVKGQAPAPSRGQTMVVRAFKFNGNTLLSNEELSQALMPLLGNPIDFARVQSSAVVVADLYRDKGWVVQTVVPPQDVSDGDVTIDIVEAVFGQVQITGTPPSRVAPEAVLQIFARQQQSGQFVNMNAIDRALLLADDLPGVTVSGNLAPGQQTAQTDLFLTLSDEPLLAGNASIDNTGSVSTGMNRVNLALSVNSPLGRGDALSASAMNAQGSDYARLAYSIPLGSDGWRLGANASHLGYVLITQAYASLDAKGSSTTSGLELSYPLVRSRTLNASANLTIDKKEYLNLSGGATTSDYKNFPLTLGLTASGFDALGGGGANALSLYLTDGRLILDGSPTQVSDASTSQTGGGYSKVRYALSRQQQLDTGTSLYVALSGQWASKNLDSSEKFYLGGSAGVRAYPSSEAGGSFGQMLNVELRWLLPDGFNLVGFYDYGVVTQNAMNDFTGASAINTYGLQGVGMSLAWRPGAGLNLQATYARRLGDNPNPITTELNQGADQDGTFKRDRLWITASLAF
jgi:hemolysin activation/secretion protein